MKSAAAKQPEPQKSNTFVLGLLILAALWVVVRPLAGQFNAYSPENGFANAIAALFGLCAGFAAITAKPRVHWPERLTLALLLYFGVLSWGVLRSPNIGQGIAAYGEALSYGVLLAGGYVLTRLARGSGSLIARAILAAVATQALAGLWQHYVDLPQLWDSVRSGQIAVPEELSSTAGQYRLFGTDVFGSFGNPNSLAAYLLVGLGLLAGFVLRESPNAAPKLSSAIPSPLKSKLFIAALGALMFVALLWAHSKGGLVAFGALLWFAFMQWFIERNPERRTLLTRLTIAGIVGMIGVLCLGYFELLPMPDSLLVRYDYWRAASGMLSAHPLDGVGLGGFAEHYAFYKTPLGTETRDAHNDYAHFLAELGILGPLMYVAIWSILLRGSAPKNSEPERARSFEKIMLWTALIGFLMMFLGFQSLNSADIPALFSSDTRGHAIRSLLSTLLIPLLFAVTFKLTQGLTLTGAWRGFVCAASAVLIHELVDFDFKAPAVAGSLFLLGGALLGERESESPAPSQLSKASLYVLPLFVPILLVLGVWYPFVSGLARKNAMILDEWMREPVEKFDAARDMELREYLEVRKRAAESAPFDAQGWMDYADALRMKYRKKAEPAVRTQIIEAMSRAASLRPYATAPRIQYANFQMESIDRGKLTENGRAKLAMAAQSYAVAAEHYPLHPGIRLWVGDAWLLGGDIAQASQNYLKAFEIDRGIQDGNVRLASCFTDPMAGAFPRHGLDTEVLIAVLQALQKNPDMTPAVKRGLEIRRVLGLAGAIRSLERSALQDEKAATQKLRTELKLHAIALPDLFESSGDKAHAALLAAVSHELTGRDPSARAEAWKRAHELRTKALAEKSPTTPARLVEELETYYGPDSPKK